jgi:hypothetical protein
MGKKLTGDLAGIAPCAWSSEENPILSEKNITVSLSF